MFFLLLIVLSLSSCIRDSFACTSIVVGPDASEDGRGFVGQSDDGEGAGDRRLVWIPPATHPEGALRPIVNYGDFPRYVGTERNVSDYFPSAHTPKETKNVIGYVPQVRTTYGYFEANYAIANSEGVSFGESTVSAKTFSTPKPSGPSLLSMYSLSRLAAERAASAREAVLVMGSMAEKYGFYGDPSPDTGGESILVAGRKEQFIFHVLAVNASVGGAIWCAQRVPSDHVAIVANAFVIGEVDARDETNFLYSENMHAIALERGWWSGESPLHFARTFSGGEYTSKYYSGRRMWSFWNTLAPSLKVPAEYASYLASIGNNYPVTARPDRLVRREDILRDVYRNYYEDTPYDLSAGLAAGPFSTPVRYKPGLNEKEVAGTCGTGDDAGPCSHWERSISSFRSDTIYVSQHGGTANLPTTVWFLPGSALSGVFLPVRVDGSPAPKALTNAFNTVVDRSKAMWAYRELIQFAYPRWRHVKDAIQNLGVALEAEGQVAADSGADLDAHATDVVRQWRALYDSLLLRFSDGWSYAVADKDTYPKATPLGYPRKWLEAVSYDNGTEACASTCP